MRLVRTAALAAAVAVLWTPGAEAQTIPIALAPGEVPIQVEGRGEALTRPDVMEIGAGVVTTGQTARAALAANNQLAERLIAAVSAAGVEARDVRTAELSVQPRFERGDEDAADSEGRAPRIRGYVARNTVELRLRDLGRAGDIIGSLFQAGANEVNGPRFSLANPAAAEAAARRAAVADATAEANSYADALGMRVARVLRVSQRGDFDMDPRGEIIVTGSRIAGTPVEPGEVRTAIRVWIDFAMVPK